MKDEKWRKTVDAIIKTCNDFPTTSDEPTLYVSSGFYAEIQRSIKEGFINPTKEGQKEMSKTNKRQYKMKPLKLWT